MYVALSCTPATAAAVSVAAAAAVTARAIPVANLLPCEPNCIATVVLAGTEMVSTGTSVPTVGAYALL